YEAQQISLGRRVALKILPFAAVLDSQQIARFKNEAQAAAQLHHPHIVPVYAVGIERGVHYYAMQFVEGQSLDQAITELRTLEDAGRRIAKPITRSPLIDSRGKGSEYFLAVVRLGIQAAEALHAAHTMVWFIVTSSRPICCSTTAANFG